jgi:hypothetical protein
VHPMWNALSSVLRTVDGPSVMNQSDVTLRTILGFGDGLLTRSTSARRPSYVPFIFAPGSKHR